MQLQPYLNFNGRCEEAIEFYRQALGAEVLGLRRFKENPEPHPPGTLPPGTEDKVLHCSFRIGESTVMASDGRCTGQVKFEGIMLTILVKTDDEAQRIYDALAAEGQVQVPLAKTFFSSSFGMLADRFGVSWMVLVGH